MRIYFRCRYCQSALSDVEEMSGKAVACPHCQQEVIVPLTSRILPEYHDELIAKNNPDREPEAASAKTADVPIPELARRPWKQVVAPALALLACSAGIALGSRYWSKPALSPAEANQAKPLPQPIRAEGPVTFVKRTETETPIPAKLETASAAESQLFSQNQGHFRNEFLRQRLENTPTLAQAVSKPAGVQPLIVKRIQKMEEEQLRKDLKWTPEVALGDSVNVVIQNYKYVQMEHSKIRIDPLTIYSPFPLLWARPDLGGMPFRHGSNSKIDGNAVQELKVLAPKLRSYLDFIAPLDDEGKRTNSSKLLATMRKELNGKKPEWLRVEAVPTMLQLLMHEDTSIRLMLVELLSQIPDKPATIALAQRAVFDLSPDIRRAALSELRYRNREEFRPILLKALRYLWAPAAEHAAEALVALNDNEQEVINKLIATLVEDDPSKPFSAKDTHLSRELVRINHLTSCVMCHPPSLRSSEPLVVQDPLRVFTDDITMVQFHPENLKQSMSGSYYPPPLVTFRDTGLTKQLLIRADIIYLYQDFSVAQPELWPPTTQFISVRFDYVTRLKTISAKSAANWFKKHESDTTYPQREAVLFALRELTGKNAATVEEWQKLYPRADHDLEVTDYTQKLVGAKGAKLDAMLKAYREGHGPSYTEALALAISDLPSDRQDKARDFLAERLSKVSVETLKHKFQSETLELRRAAVQAAILKADPELIPDLSLLLEDADLRVANLAFQAINKLSRPLKTAKPDSEKSVSAKTTPALSLPPVDKSGD